MMSNSAWVSMVLIGVSLSVGALYAGRQPEAHMLAAGLTALILAAFAVYVNRQAIAAGVGKSGVAHTTAMGLALVWAWGGLTLLITYGAAVLPRFPEWWQFLLGFAAAAIATLFFARLLARDAAQRTDDVTILKLGRTLTLIQLIGVVAGVISMFVDGKFPRAMTHNDWAACNIFFFGALAIAAISANALIASRPNTG